MVTRISDPPGPDYPALFRHQIVRAVAYACELIPEVPSVSPSAVDIAYVLQVLDFAVTFSDGWTRARNLYPRLTPIMERAGRYEEWSRYLEKGIRAGAQYNDLSTSTDLAYQHGLFALVLGQGEIAHDAFCTSYEVSTLLQAPEKRARALNGLARLAHNRGQLQEAITYTNRALSLVEKTTSEERATGYRLLGTIAFSQQEANKALAYFQQDLALWQERGDRHKVALALVNVGSALRALQRFDEAIHAYTIALDVFERSADPVHLAATQMNLGNVYLKLSRFEEALEVYAAADWQLRDAQDATRLAMLYNNIGMAYAGLQQWDQAETFYRDSMTRWQHLSNDRARVNTMDNLGELYLAWHKQAEAMAILSDAYRIALTLEDNHLIDMVYAHLAQATHF